MLNESAALVVRDTVVVLRALSGCCSEIGGSNDPGVCGLSPLESSGTDTEDELVARSKKISKVPSLLFCLAELLGALGLILLLSLFQRERKGDVGA